ncbi:hypothetical protein PORCRE_2062 [Porphyromonas crevioricanis JCM 15906]|uniref:Uncharacterized protein n=1 Tax=Porphyromonas crevioricanis JCM 15906 TaxID=1305617 RepID=T1DU82_9PORP|nr:hypothetical protein PORCRE_2062 [Porphyromonas crevioricanis JCM 15906]GAD06698.1 hypothetical protein PORCAN_297 [Porphyromonas crevioricanis JCM 13913]
MEYVRQTDVWEAKLLAHEIALIWMRKSKDSFCVLHGLQPSFPLQS